MINKQPVSMKIFMNTTIAGLAIVILAALLIAILKIEKHKATMEADKQTIRELTDELHSIEAKHLKCDSSVQVEQY